MAGNTTIVFDIETDGLNANLIHCLSYLENGKMTTLFQYEDMISFLKKDDITLVGHNIIRYDIPTLERLLKIKIKCNLIDTLALSWYLYPNKRLHGLESWGKLLGKEKVGISDWSQDSENYQERCETDVEINSMLFNYLNSYLNEIYNGKTKKIISYLNFKLTCIKDQEHYKWKLDTDLIKKNLDFFIREKEKKTDELRSLMEKTSTLSEVNPSSNTQIKNWLFSKGWKPLIFKKSKITGKLNPQLYDSERKLCSSVVEIDTSGLLLGLSVLTHRIGMLKQLDSFGEYAEASCNGFTNTLRFKHMNLVNLPKVTNKGDFSDGIFIRKCLSNNEGLLCGSDMQAIEDSTKQHYMYFYDPEFVKAMRVKGFDPHLDIAVLSNLISQEESDLFKKLKKLKDSTPLNPEETKEFFYLNGLRSKAKTVNFAAMYKAGFKKIAETANISLEEAKLMLKTYWNRNNAVLKASESFTTKTLSNDSMWVFNPVSKLWYNLRNAKDVFSTVNQSTAAYCFDLYVQLVKKKFKVIGQFHDEIIISLTPEKEEELKEYLHSCIEKVNSILKLNVPIGISMDFGTNYAEIH